MIELRWKPIALDTELPEKGMVKLFKPSPPDALAPRTVEVCCYAVLQYREGAMPVRVEGNVVTATAPSEWKDVELEE